jgi:phenylalanyl-tRNA synthetase beta chain
LKLSLEWLADHIRLDGPPTEIADRLTASGSAVDRIESIGKDTVLELEIAANRPDCLSVRGLARELGALYRCPLADLGPLVEVREAGSSIAGSFTLHNEVPELCSRFTARIVRGVTVGPSPDWVVSRLERSGLRSINNVVDVTNYVMLELGHPLHAFDLGTLRGGTLHVRLAGPGERLKTLDGVERRLRDWMILIADGERPVSLAGVMGGHDTEISGATRDVLLEAAWWDPVTIFRTGRELGLRSDAAYRFERGADREATLAAVNRAAGLLAELAGGEVAPGIVDDYPGRAAPRQVPLREGRAGRLLGMPVARETEEEILERLGFRVLGDSVEVPSHRADVTREEDLIEEVGRIAGYDRVPEELPLFASEEHGWTPTREAEAGVRRLLEDAGFQEALNFSMVARGDDALCSSWPGAVVALTNPMSERGDVLRSSLLPSLVRNIAHNVSHGARRVRLYELGRVFRDRGGEDLPEERLYLGVAAHGSAAPPHWSRQPVPVDPYDLTGVLEDLVRGLRREPPRRRRGGPDWLRSEAAVTWMRGEREIGWIGALEPGVALALGLEEPAVVAEVDLSALLEGSPEPVSYRPIPRYPPVNRDLSLVLPLSRTYGEVEAVIERTGGDWVVDIAPFDRYTGPGLPEGTVGLSVSITYRHPERTLLSEEVEEVQGRLVAALQEELGASLRE